MLVVSGRWRCAREASCTSAHATLQCTAHSPVGRWRKQPQLGLRMARASRARCCVVQNNSSGRPTASIPYQSPDSTAPCISPIVVVDNDAKPRFTELTLEVMDYPGLLRVVAWVLNGMGVKVHNAVLKTTPEGIAKDIFWLTDYNGQKLSLDAAESVAERIQDFVIYCDVNNADFDSQDFSFGNVEINNIVHPDFTQVRIREQTAKPGFLLEVASALTGLGVIVREAEVRSCTDCSLSSFDLLPEQPNDSRVLHFWVTDSRKQKLDQGRISALVYTLQLIMGKGSMPTIAPNMSRLVNNLN